MAEEKKQETTVKETRPSVAELKAENKAWKEFTIPLGKKVRKAVRYKVTPKAITVIKQFLVRHMKVRDRDVGKIKLDKYLNEFIWSRGIKRTVSKVRVKARMEGEFVRAELAELTEGLKFKKERLERRETKTRAPVKGPAAEVKEDKTEEEKTEEKEKQASVVEAGQEMEKVAAKQQKHHTKVSKQPKASPRRMSLQK